MGMADTTPWKYGLSGGALALDFANTVGWRKRAKRAEHLRNYADLLAWAKSAGALSGPEAERLAGEGRRRPGATSAALRRALRLREAIYGLFSALALRAAPAAEDLRALNAALPAALSRLRIGVSENVPAWEWTGDELALDRMLWPVARSAADLLTSQHLGRVRECGDEHCGWLFLDTSRNQSRRWCSMSDCGNRAKARRHYARTRSGKVKG